MKKGGGKGGSSWVTPPLVGLVLTVVMLPVLAFALIYRTNLFPRAAGMSTPSVYWGAYIAGSTYDSTCTSTTGTSVACETSPWDLWDMGGQTTAKFESHSLKGAGIIHFGAPWYNSTAWPNGYFNFSPSLANLMGAVRTHGSIPLLDWGSWDLGNGTANQPDFSLKNIAAGNYVYNGQTFDQFVTKWATDAKTWGHPFFLRFNWEMNGNWQFPWSAQLNGNTAADYVAAWRHVHDIFTSVGATNVTWVWCPNISGPLTLPDAQLYPGDAYVDWTCLDGYNSNPSGWLTFSQVFAGGAWNGNRNSYQEILNLVPNKPLMIGESASVEDPADPNRKAAWITDALVTQLPNNFPLVKAFVWFNWQDKAGDTYPIETSVNSQTAIASALAWPYFSGNVYGNLNAAPIAPLNPAGTISPVPSPAITPTPTPAVIVPTPTPTPGTSAILLQAKFAGIASDRGAILATRVIVQDKVATGVAHAFQKVFSGTTALTFTWSTTANAYQTTVPGLNLNAGTTYEILVKGPSHLQMRVTPNGFSLTAAQLGMTVTVDATAVTVRAGDVIDISSPTGNVDGQDGKLTIEDLTAITYFYTNLSVPVGTTIPSRRDINRDGFITLEDVTLVSNNFTNTTVLDDN